MAASELITNAPKFVGGFISVSGSVAAVCCSTPLLFRAEFGSLMYGGTDLGAGCHLCGHAFSNNTMSPDDFGKRLKIQLGLLARAPAAVVDASTHVYGGEYLRYGRELIVNVACIQSRGRQEDSVESGD